MMRCVGEPTSPARTQPNSVSNATGEPGGPVHQPPCKTRTKTRIAGLSHKSPVQSFASLSVAAVKSPSVKIDVAALVVPQVTSDLLHQPIEYSLAWNHLSGIDLADPQFGQPGRIDILPEIVALWLDCLRCRG